MNKLLKLLLVFLLALSLQSVFAVLPAQLTVDNTQLELNGSGMRSKFFLSLYDAGLYVANTTNNASDIINGNKTMAIQLNITSSMITAKKMKSATLEGFVKSTNDNLNPIQNKVDKLLNIFDQGIGDGDVYLFAYKPNQGLSVIKNAQLITTIDGLDFKKAFFGIWLSDNPVQSSLKQQLLGIITL